MSKYIGFICAEIINISAIKLISKTIESAQKRQVTTWYNPFCSKEQVYNLISNEKITIFASCDAGYASFTNSSSIQFSLILLGTPNRRDGVTTCSGRNVESFARKTHRVSTSTLSADIVALSDTLDIAL